MAPWECPLCRRSFGRRQQSHECEPAESIDSWFADRPPAWREIFDAIASHLAELGPVVVEAVSVGVLIKRSRTFLELRPKRGALSLSLLLSRAIEHDRVRRSIRTSARRVALFIDLHDVDDVDDQLRGWISESYFESPV